MLFSTTVLRSNRLLTLVATPVFYTLFDDALAWLPRRFAGWAQVDRGEAEVAVDHRVVHASSDV